MSGSIRWWQLVIILGMVLVYGLAGSDDLRQRERDALVCGSFVAGW